MHGNLCRVPTQKVYFNCVVNLQISGISFSTSNPCLHSIMCWKIHAYILLCAGNTCLHSIMGWESMCTLHYVLGIHAYIPLCTGNPCPRTFHYLLGIHAYIPLRAGNLWLHSIMCWESMHTFHYVLGIHIGHAFFKIKKFLAWGLFVFLDKKPDYKQIFFSIFQ